MLDRPCAGIRAVGGMAAGLLLVAWGLWPAMRGVKVQAAGEAATAAAAGLRPIVQVSANVVVETEWVELGQIATLETGSQLGPMPASGSATRQAAAADAPVAAADALAHIRVARVPLCGQTVRIPAAFLAVKLRQAGIDPDSLELVLPANGWIVITRVGSAAPALSPTPPPAAPSSEPSPSSAGTSLTPTDPERSSGGPTLSPTSASPGMPGVGRVAAELRSTLLPAVESALLEQVAVGEPSTARVQVQLDQVLGLDELAQRVVARELTPASLRWDFRGWRPQVGPFVLFASLGLTGQQLGTVTVYGRWQAERQLWVAAAPLPAGQRLTGQEVERRWVALSAGLSSGGAADDWVRDPQQLAGAELRLPLGAGEPVKMAYLRWPALYPKGTSLVGWIQRGQVRLQVGLTAAEDGYRGQPFLALSPSTGRLLRVLADADGKGTVAVLGPASPASAS